MLQTILDTLFPKRCASCGRVGKYICGFCQPQIQVIDPIIGSICPVCERPAIGGRTHPICRGKYTPDGLTAFFRYAGPVKKILKNIKYQSASDMLNELVGFILPTSYNFINNEIVENFDFIIPIPLHPQRLKDRGFNQAFLISKLLSEKLSIQVEEGVLKRIKNTVPQASMKSKNERLENIKSAFGILDGSKSIAGRKIVLVDDIFTTGVTIRSACNVLKRSGAEFVWAITLAR